MSLLIRKKEVFAHNLNLCPGGGLILGEAGHQLLGLKEPKLRSIEDYRPGALDVHGIDTGLQRRREEKLYRLIAGLDGRDLRWAFANGIGDLFLR
jgi:hypothetical protein